MSRTEFQMMTVGELRSKLSGLSDSCEINFSSEVGDLVFCRIKTRHRDENDKPLIVSFELGELSDIEADASV